MSLKSSLLALANNIGMCQENARSIKQALAGGLAEAAGEASTVENPMQYEKLWVNANPTSAFAAGDVTVDNSAGYDAFIIYVMYLSGNAYTPYLLPKSVINDNTDHYMIEQHVASSGGKVSEAYRRVKLAQAADSDNLVLTFTGCSNNTIDTYGSAASSSAANSSMIPEIIIGIKY